MAQLSGKVCIITGGAGSIGLATARLFLREGAKVMLVDLRESDLKRALADLNSGSAASVAADVTRADQVKNYVEKTVTKWGRIDVLFSNAGNFGSAAPVTEFPEDVFDSVMAVHIKGAFLACKYGLPHMNDGGSVIITSSTVGIRAPGGGGSAYTTAKHAQVGLMRTVAKEVAPRGIRVNTIHPGPVDNTFQAAVEKDIGDRIGLDATKLINEAVTLKRHASPEEIARSVLYLASDQSSFMTGSTLVVDGGLSS